ncbi:MAG: translocation/assembly module TamB domain-containing protein [Rhodothermia bacterium]|nr:translocation/assembly module TamB domain-containing protein [Rhodothermia bacterium]
MRYLWAGIRFAFWLALWGALGAALFALSPTGRGLLRERLEEAFAARFQGRLHVGDIVPLGWNRFRLLDIGLRDPEGVPVLWVDTLELALRPLELLRNRIVFRSVHASGLRLALFRHAPQRPWALWEALAPRRPPPLERPGPSWLLYVDWLSWRRARLWQAEGQIGELLSASARIHLEWGTDYQLVEFSHLEAELPRQGLHLRRLEGQLYLDSAGLEVNRLRLETERSRLALELRLRGAGWRERPSRLGSEALQVRLQPSQIALKELASWLPVPSRDTLWVELWAEGRLDRLRLRTAALHWRESALRLRGDIRGLPDWRRAFLSLRLEPSRVLAADWRPYADLLRITPPTLPDRLNLEGRLDGFLRDWVAQLRLDGGSESGALETDLNVKLPQNGPAQYAGLVRLSSWNPARWLGPQAPEGAFNGALELRGRDVNWQRASVEVRARLVGSRWQRMRIDSLWAELSWADRLAAARLALLSPDGAFALEGHARFAALRLWPEEVRLQGSFTDWMPWRWLKEGSRDAAPLSGRWSVETRGPDWESLSASAALRLEGPQPEEALEAQLELESTPQGQKRIRFDSSALEAELEGRFSWEGLADLSRYWALRFQGYANELRALGSDSAAFAAVRAPEPGTWVALRWRPKRLAALRSWWASAAGWAWIGVGSWEARAEPDSLRMRLLLQADSLRSPAASMGSARMQLEASVLRATPMRWGYRFQAQLRDLALGPRRLAQLEALAAYRAPLTEWYLSLRGQEPDVRLQASGLLSQQAGQSHFTLIDLYVGTPAYAWRNPEEGRLVLSAEGLSVEALELVNGPQRLRVRGRLGSAERDSLELYIEALQMAELSELLQSPIRLAGQLEARLALRGLPGAWGALTGALRVRGLQVDEALLGDLEAESRFDPQGERAIFSVRLHKDLPPGRIGIANKAELIGSWSLRTRAPDEPVLRAEAHLEALDLFFLEYLLADLFSQVGGWASGELRLEGHPGAFALEGTAQIGSARVRLSQFDAELTVSGSIRFSPRALELTNLALQDDRGGSGRLEGRLFHNGRWGQWAFDLRGEAQNLLVLDNRERTGELFYGTVSASGRFSLTGPESRPVLWIEATADPRSELFLTVRSEELEEAADGFIVYLEPVPLLDTLSASPSPRPRALAGASRERSFLEALEMTLNITAPEGATVWLLFDPRIGDELRAVGSGRLQLVLREGRFFTFGSFSVSQGEYRFTARDVFVRRFELEPGGVLRWDGDPVNAQLELAALYRARVDLGLSGSEANARVPLGIRLRLSGRTQTPEVTLEFTLLEETTDPQLRARIAQLNQSENRLLEAASVLLTGRLWQEGGLGPTTAFGGLLASGGTTTGLYFLSSQVNQLLRGLLENLDIQLDLQDLQRGGGVNVDIALRLFDDRLLIRRVGTLGGVGAPNTPAGGPEGAGQWFGDLTVAFRLSRRLSVEFFHRTGGTYWQLSPETYGLGLRYRTDFPAWRYVLWGGERVRSARAGL